MRDALVQTRFSAPLVSLTAYPPVLVMHVAAEYMTPPPPLSSAEKFWGVFMPIAQRQHEAEKLVFGEGGRGSGSEEVIIEVLVRGADDTGRRRGIERVLEGWKILSTSACELSQLESLKPLWARRPIAHQVWLATATAYCRCLMLMLSKAERSGSDAKCIVQSEPDSGATTVSLTSTATISSRQ